MRKPLRILVDANILFSALLFNGPERRVLRKGRYLFYTTDFNVWELIDVLQRKVNFSKREALEIVRALPIQVIPLAVYKTKLFEADQIIGGRDKRDVPLLALALSVENDGIWTSDKDFEVVQ